MKSPLIPFIVAAGLVGQIVINPLPGSGGGGGGITALTGDVTASGTGSVAATLAAGSASVLNSGTLPDARFPATLPAISGANLTNLNATNLASGAVPDARLSSNVTLNTTILGSIPLINASFFRVLGSNLATGDNDIYTVPAGKMAIISTQCRYNNSGIGNIVYYSEIKVSGTYYRIIGNLTIGNTVGSCIGFSTGILMQAGDILAVNVATNNGLNFAPGIIEFDNTSILKLSRTLSLSTGDQTIYTCPVSKTCTVINPFGPPDLNKINIIVYNSDSTTRNFKFHNVPSGGSATTANIIANLAVGATSIAGYAGEIILNAGDFINLNVDTSAVGQYVSMAVIEK